MTSAPTLEYASPPAELTLAEGEYVCSIEIACGRETYPLLEASLDGAAASLQHGQSTELGAYRFVNSAFRVARDEWTCSGGGSYLRLAAWR
jgi:hypothetical protein